MYFPPANNTDYILDSLAFMKNAATQHLGEMNSLYKTFSGTERSSLGEHMDYTRMFISTYCGLSDFLNLMC
jgi:hypothetical protein